METVHQSLGPILVENARRMRRPFSILEKLPANHAYTRNRAKLTSIVQDIIETRRNDPGAYEDLLQMLIDAADEDTGERMTDKQVRDEVITLFVAGHETTATALTWAFKLLSESPSVRRQLQAEVDAVLASRVPTTDDYAKLPFTLAVFEETLRLYPPVPFLPRQMLEPDTLGGHVLPAGSNVVVNTFTLHRHPACWDNPDYPSVIAERSLRVKRAQVRAAPAASACTAWLGPTFGEIFNSTMVISESLYVVFRLY